MENEETDTTSGSPVTHTEHHPATDSPAREGDGLGERVGVLEKSVEALVAQLQEFAPDPSDASPKRVPWTHRGGR